MPGLKKIPFFLFLLVLFFCLHGSVENYGYLHLNEVVMVGLVITVCIASLFLVILFFTRNYAFASLVTFFISLWYLFFGVIHDLIKSETFLSFLRSYTIIVSLLIICTILWIIFLIRNRQLQLKLVFYLNLLLLIYCIFDGFLLLGKYNRADKITPMPAVVFDASVTSQKPNVYYLLLDEYAGYTSLKDSFGFRNDVFYDFLQQNGFEQLPVFANYKSTVYSMSSILNMRYINRTGNNKDIDQFDYLDRLEEINNASVVAAFKNMGYSIYNFSIFDVNDMPAITEDNDNGIITRHRMLLTDKILHKRADREIGWNIPPNFKRWLPFLKNTNLLIDIENNDRAIQQSRELARSRKKAPFFCYTHVMMPHWQYYFDSAGKANPLHLVLPKASITNKKLYLGYLQYSSRIMSGLITDIILADPSAIVVLMSDHGFRNYADQRSFQPYHFDNICAVRFPDKNYLPYKEKWSTVNFFRYVFNCEFGQKIPYLPDSAIFVNEYSKLKIKNEE
ncbi:MAG TPA: hypothetical protein VK489_12455 [Ferruginibacter sp.]|nr:hypothetical protein [Ferruginibacter sp.]